MAEDTTTEAGEPTREEVLARRRAENEGSASEPTVTVLEPESGEQKPGVPSANGDAPQTVPIQIGVSPSENEQAPTNVEPNEVGLLAFRDPASGDLRLGEGASTGGAGLVHVSGTDLTFEDQEALQEFIDEANAKAERGVPLAEILGENADAVSIIENGQFSGQTLADLLPPPHPVSPGEGAGKGAAADFTNNPPRQPRGEDPDGPGDGSPSANGANGHTNGIGNGDDLGNISDGSSNTVLLREDDGASQPGRDDDGNLLPGAEGRVTLDDFRRINDLDGKGNIAPPLHPDGGSDDGSRRFEPPMLDRIDPPNVAPVGSPEPGPTFEPGGDGTPEIPARDISVDADPGAQPPPHGTAPAADADRGAATPPDPNVDRTADPGETDQTTARTSPQAAGHAAPAAASGTSDDAVSVTPVAAATAAGVSLDTFDTGVAPSTATAAEAFRPAAEEPLPDVPPAAMIDPAGPPPLATVLGADDQESDEYSGVPATARPLADVFDEERLGAAATVASAGSSEEGGRNLLERILDKVQDILFEDDPAPASPVQLPAAATADVLSTSEALTVEEQPVAVPPADPIPDSDFEQDEN